MHVVICKGYVSGDFSAASVEFPRVVDFLNYKNTVSNFRDLIIPSQRHLEKILRWKKLTTVLWSRHF